MTPNARGSRSRQAPSGRTSQRGRMSPASIAALAIAGLVICSLIASSLASIWMDRGAPAEPPIALDDSGRDYENEMRTAVAGNPEDVVALVSLANLLATRGNDDEAADLYARAIELDPGNARYRMDFALSLVRSGAFADAEVQYRKVLESDERDAEAWYFLGELYARWSPPRLDDAAAAFESAIAAQPGSLSADQARTALARLEGQRATPAPGGTP